MIIWAGGSTLYVETKSEAERRPCLPNLPDPQGHHQATLSLGMGHLAPASADTSNESSLKAQSLLRDGQNKDVLDIAAGVECILLGLT